MFQFLKELGCTGLCNGPQVDLKVVFCHALGKEREKKKGRREGEREGGRERGREGGRGKKEEDEEEIMCSCVVLPEPH